MQIEGEELKDVVVCLTGRRAWASVADPPEIVPMRLAEVGRGRDSTATGPYSGHVPVQELRVRVEVDEAELQRACPGRRGGPVERRRGIGAVTGVPARERVARAERRAGENEGCNE